MNIKTHNAMIMKCICGTGLYITHIHKNNAKHANQNCPKCKRILQLLHGTIHVEEIMKIVTDKIKERHI